MAKLNDTNIGKLRWDASKLTKFGNPPQFQAVSDTEVSGLSVRIYPPKLNGQSKKTFFLKYGVRRDVYKIGAWGEWTLEQARDEARKLRRSFYDHGVDPNKSKKRRIRDEKARETVEQLVAVQNLWPRVVPLGAGLETCTRDGQPLRSRAREFKRQVSVQDRTTKAGAAPRIQKGGGHPTLRSAG